MNVEIHFVRECQNEHLSEFYAIPWFLPFQLTVILNIFGWLAHHASKLRIQIVVTNKRCSSPGLCSMSIETGLTAQEENLEVPFGMKADWALVAPFFKI
jgi:hypothetical protein